MTIKVSFHFISSTDSHSCKSVLQVWTCQVCTSNYVRTLNVYSVLRNVLWDTEAFKLFQVMEKVSSLEKPHPSNVLENARTCHGKLKMTVPTYSMLVRWCCCVQSPPNGHAAVCQRERASGVLRWYPCKTFEMFERHHFIPQMVAMLVLVYSHQRISRRVYDQASRSQWIQTELSILLFGSELVKDQMCFLDTS